MTRRHHAWEPTLFDDHGQPLCATEADEAAILEDLRAAGPDDHAVWQAVVDAVHSLTDAWRLDPDDATGQAILWVRIAERARRDAADQLSSLTQDGHPADQLRQHVAHATHLTIDHLTTTYPINPEPAF